MADSRATTNDFPTYASLTQTIGWSDTKAAPQIAAEAAAAIDPDKPRYIEGALLGAGGMGKVVLAMDARIGREVAVKELHTERVLSPEEHARFVREARVQGQLEHPSIVPVYDIDRRPDGTIFFTMRRVVGKTLHAILRDLRSPQPTVRYTQHELLTAFATVCLAIDYAHSRGVIHRDLKPANLMLGDFGEVYVLDWGLARLVGDSQVSDSKPGDSERLSMPGELLGTPLYMAPEQMADPDVGRAADVFSLGAILFEILTLVPLRDPNMVFVPPDARPSVRTPERVVAPELETICVTATAIDARDRYPSARALQEAVLGYLDRDRDRESRRDRAAAHVKDARAALDRADRSDTDYETERGNAMRHLAHALAFDPSNREHVTMLAEILERPPRVVPPEVREQVQGETRRTIRTYARYTGPTMISWFVFLPILAWIGIRDWSLIAVIAIPASLAALVGFFAVARSAFSNGMVIATLILVMLAMGSTSTMFGPMIIVPTIIIATTTCLQAFPTRAFRRFSVVLACIVMFGLVVLEYIGITSAYAFEHGTWIVRPQLVELSKEGSLGLLLLIHLTALVAPVMFISDLRRNLSKAQQRQLLQSWHFRRLGEALMRT